MALLLHRNNSGKEQLLPRLGQDPSNCGRDFKDAIRQTEQQQSHRGWLASDWFSPPSEFSVLVDQAPIRPAFSESIENASRRIWK